MAKTRPWEGANLKVGVAEYLWRMMRATARDQGKPEEPSVHFRRLEAFVLSLQRESWKIIRCDRPQGEDTMGCSKQLLVKQIPKFQTRFIAVLNNRLFYHLVQVDLRVAGQEQEPKLSSHLFFSCINRILGLGQCLSAPLPYSWLDPPSFRVPPSLACWLSRNSCFNQCYSMQSLFRRALTDLQKPRCARF